MRKRNLSIMIVMLLSFGLLMTSCKKDENASGIDSNATRDDAFAESIFDNVGHIANEAYTESSTSVKSTSNRIFLSDCATISLDTAATPRELIIDFGTENCLCNDGKYRRGKIIISFTGQFWYPGTVITYGFEDFYVNDNHVEGTKVLTNMGFDENNHLSFYMEVVAVIHRADNGGTFSWNSNRTHTWIDGYETYNRHDDVYLIEGVADGITVSGDTWTRETITPLRIELDCRYVVSGILEIIPEGRPARLVDFGNGECDNIITLTVNGETYTIYLP